MAQTLEQTGNYEPLTDPDRDNHVVLITDGWQWCDPYDPNTRFDPVDKVAALHDQGMTVHVVGFGSMVDTLTLNRSAVAGGTALPGCNEDSTDPSNPNNCYLQADDLTELRDALDDIGREVTEETCDGFDNDCDGEVDEGYDMDGDGFTTCGTVEDSPGETDDGLADCDDDNSDVNPAAEEICDGLDNDCDGRRDPGCACEQGEEQSCGTDIGECTPGTQFCEDGTWTECTGGVQPAETDVCDGTDEDCDEDIDEDADCGPERRCMDGECVRFSRDPDKPIDEEEPPSENGPRDAGTSAKEVAPSQDGGCCSVGGVRRPTGPLAAAGLLALLGLVVVRRRRR
jgi:MYXO-CTERM domain-containing protein